MGKPLQRLRLGLLSVAIGLALYLLFWPVPIAPVAWVPPSEDGGNGAFEHANRLRPLQLLSIGHHDGPEDVALDPDGRIYVSSHQGHIVRLEPDGTHPTVFARTGGRPLGIDFDHQGNLIVADALRGLLSVSKDGAVRTLADSADGIPIRYADDVDVAPDGRIYFTDASTKFPAAGSRSTLEASKLEIMEHRGTGRLLVYDPVRRAATMVLGGLVFANGVAVSPDGEFLLLNETGSYRVLRVSLTGSQRGQVDSVIDGLPGFPDNIATGLGGRFWVALVNPRNYQLDGVAGWPFMRKVVWRLPEAVQPEEVASEHVFAMDADGHVLVDLRDAAAPYPFVTSAIETPDYLYLGSLVAPKVARVPRAALHLL